jgi:hypothetical protein
MTQVFADDDQASSAGLIGFPLQRPGPAWGPEQILAPAMMAGKGVRAVRCVGCQRETLPRADDGAPLCSRCCEVLAEATSRSRLPWRRKS